MATFVDKKFTVKIFDPLGTTLQSTLKASEIKNDIAFSSRINGGLGQLKLDLNRPFDDFGEGDDIDFMNIVKIFEVDESNPTGRLIHTGFISAYQPYVKGSEQGVVVVVLGLISLLSFAFYKDGASFTVTQTTADPGQIFKDIIDHFNTVYAGNLIDYTGSSIDNIGTNVSYEFEKRKWREALEDTFGLVGSGFYWFVDETGTIFLKPKPSTATHTFTISKDIEEFITNKSSEEVVNTTRVFFSSGTSDDSDASSITQFGTRESTVTDTKITDVTTAAQRADQEVNDNKDAKVDASLKINTQFDIESVSPGDTCKIRNLSGDQLTFSDNMQIQAVRYTWDFIVLELEEINTSFGIEMNRFVNPTR